MDQSSRVCEIADALHEELDADAKNLTSFQVGAVVRAAAERCVEEVDAERAALVAYLEYHCPNDSRLAVALQQCMIGAHRRNRSQSMEAVVERSR